MESRAPVIRKNVSPSKSAVVRGITGPFNAVRACSERPPYVAGRAFFGIGTFTSDVGNCVVLRKVIQVVQIKAKLLALCWYRIRSKSTPSELSIRIILSYLKSFERDFVINMAPTCSLKFSTSNVSLSNGEHPANKVIFSHPERFDSVAGSLTLAEEIRFSLERCTRNQMQNLYRRHPLLRRRWCIADRNGTTELITRCSVVG